MRAANPVRKKPLLKINLYLKSLNFVFLRLQIIFLIPITTIVSWVRKKTIDLSINLEHTNRYENPKWIK